MLMVGVAMLAGLFMVIAGTRAWQARAAAVGLGADGTRMRPLEDVPAGSVRAERVERIKVRRIGH